MTEIRFRLIENELSNHASTGLMALLIKEINIENAQ